MIEYFNGHKDCLIINEYLNSLPEDSADFKVVYLLRKTGEEFIYGTLTLEDVSCFQAYRQVSDIAEAFIRQMKCYTFYSALCHIAADELLTPLEMKIKEEIEHPSWRGDAKSFRQKISRWWYSRWKHPLVYNEWWFPALVTLIWSIVRNQKVVKG